MNKRAERLLLLVVDLISINIAYIVFFLVRVKSGWFDLLMTPDFWIPMPIIYLYWLILFIFVGLYRSWFAQSRFDELSSLLKTTMIGTFLLFFIIFLDDSARGVVSNTRMVIMIYWGMIFVIVSTGRLLIRAVQKNLLMKGIGRRATLIVGTGRNAAEIKRELEAQKAFGLDVAGFLDIGQERDEQDPQAIPISGGLQDFERILGEKDIKEIVFALEHKHDDVVVELLARCGDREIGLKIVPDLYEILSGQAKTMALYGVPLIDINPALMPAWEAAAKRILDIVVALIILTLSAPILLLTSIVIKLNSKGPIFYTQERCGLNGRLFKIIKFRSMYIDAEHGTGPVWSQKNDPRVTAVGRFIRKVRIDEIPQMWNILKGEMSLIGPRPERPFFVEKLSHEIPYYKRRLRVRPGVTGWAQVKHKYDENIEDVKAKLKYDLFYIENMSIRMDIKILIRTIFVVLFGKGHFE